MAYKYHQHEWVPTRGGLKDICRVPGCSEVRMEAKTYVRSGAHETEIEAAQRATYRAGTDKARLHGLLSEHGPLTTDQMSVMMMRSYGRPDRPNMYASRILDLVEDGYVEDSGFRKPTRTGTAAIVWQLVTEVPDE